MIINCVRFSAHGVTLGQRHLARHLATVYFKNGTELLLVQSNMLCHMYENKQSNARSNMNKKEVNNLHFCFECYTGEINRISSKRVTLHGLIWKTLLLGQLVPKSQENIFN